MTTRTYDSSAPASPARDSARAQVAERETLRIHTDTNYYYSYCIVRTRMPLSSISYVLGLISTDVQIRRCSKNRHHLCQPASLATRLQLVQPPTQVSTYQLWHSGIVYGWYPYTVIPPWPITCISDQYPVADDLETTWPTGRRLLPHEPDEQARSLGTSRRHHHGLSLLARLPDVQQFSAG